MQRRDKRPLPSLPSFFLRLLLEIRLWQDAYFPNTETCLQCSESWNHPPSVSPLCHSSNNTPGTRSLTVTAPNPSFHSTDFWIKEGRFPHLWIVLCYGAHASFHASFSFAVCIEMGAFPYLHRFGAILDGAWEARAWMRFEAGRRWRTRVIIVVNPLYGGILELHNKQDT